MDKKKALGQFYTVAADYILDGLPKPPVGARVVEPFAGNSDLVKWLGKAYEVEAYDIDPKHTYIKKRDTLKDPPAYEGCWVVTNPPFLARNKTKDKAIFDTYGLNDLYKCAIRSMLGCEGGLLIIPAGFFFSERKMDCECRDEFMRRYEITRVKYFEETVFPDTPTTVVAFSFTKHVGEPLTRQDVEWVRKPGDERKTFEMTKENKWIVGGHVFNKSGAKGIKRYVDGANHDGWKITHMTLSALDSGKSDGRIRLKFMKDYVYKGKESSRTYATIMTRGDVPVEKQKRVCDAFNAYVEGEREKYWSLFLPQFRESKEYARKRIPFELAYGIIEEIIEKTK